MRCLHMPRYREAPSSDFPLRLHPLPHHSPPPCRFRSVRSSTILIAYTLPFPDTIAAIPSSNMHCLDLAVLKACLPCTRSAYSPQSIHNHFPVPLTSCSSVHLSLPRETSKYESGIARLLFGPSIPPPRDIQIWKWDRPAALLPIYPSPERHPNMEVGSPRRQFAPPL